MAVLFISTSGVLGKYIDLPVPITIFLRSIIAAVVLITYCKIRKINLNIPLKDKLPIMLGGLFLGAHWITYFYAIKLSNVAIGMLTLFTFPAITTILEPIITKTKFQLVHLLLGGTALFGIYLLTPEFNVESSSFWGVCLGVCSALCYSIRVIMLKPKVVQYNQSSLMIYQLIAISVVLLPAYWLMDHTNVFTFLPSTILLGVLTTAIGHTLFVYSLNHFTAASASLISSLQPVYGIVLAMILLQEYPSLKTVMGGLVIISTVLIESWRIMRLNKAN